MYQLPQAFIDLPEPVRENLYGFADEIGDWLGSMQRQVAAQVAARNPHITDARMLDHLFQVTWQAYMHRYGESMDRQLHEALQQCLEGTGLSPEQYEAVAGHVWSQIEAKAGEVSLNPGSPAETGRDEKTGPHADRIRSGRRQGKDRGR